MVLLLLIMFNIDQCEYNIKKKKRAIGCDGIQRVGGVKRKWKKSLHIRIRT